MSAAENSTWHLNEMQRLMRRWAELAPYNAMLAVRIACRSDVEHLQMAVAKAMHDVGWGVPVFAGDRVRFVAPPRVNIETPQVALERHIGAEMNRPFSHNEVPVRFFVIEEPDDTHWLGFTVDHWICDEYTAWELLRRIYPGGQLSEPPRRQPRKQRQPFTRKRWASCLRLWPELGRQLLQHRDSFRMPLGEPLDFRVGTFHRDLPNGLIARLVEVAKRSAATVNDLFLAACAQAFGEFRDTHFTGRRRSIGVAMPMAARRSGDTPGSSNSLGCSLSYGTLVIDRPEASSVGRLIGQVAAKTRELKASGRAVATALALTRVWWDLSRGRYAKATLFQRGIPLVCGVSHANLNRIWIRQAEPRLLEYRRVGPTGPIAPMTFMIAQIGDRLTLDVTYRTTAFAEETAKALADRFVVYLDQIVAP